MNNLTLKELITLYRDTINNKNIKLTETEKENLLDKIIEEATKIERS